ncbi:BPSL0067 family protein [Chitinimonas arctica]|uniref:BPSL0067 family protein n=1 Tax=Chitinimonas arctica TaxID=2594795 RepID=A0A516SHA6_9NEIS|nr:BPSL0067 family protein [Chitinimonas arctica]QDQ27510.1 BPSL0067 family protein [Chitinimonas arctica]
MPYLLGIAEKDVFGKAKFVNAKGNTECVEFVVQTTSAPSTIGWNRGDKISDLPPGKLARGTAIATFDANGRYPTDTLGKHAAIYLSHDAHGIRVLDQWRAQGEVRERVIHFNKPKGTSRSNDASTFYVIK